MLHPIRLVFLGLSTLAVVGVWGMFALNGGFIEMDAIVSLYPSTGVAGLQNYPELDHNLMSIVAFNLSAVNSVVRHFMVQFLANLAIIPIILGTEDTRAGLRSWVK